MTTNNKRTKASIDRVSRHLCLCDLGVLGVRLAPASLENPTKFFCMNICNFCE